MRLDGKVALVTGAAGGIGLATAEMFAREGATVYGGDVKSLDSLSDAVRPLVLDVTDLARWEAAVASILEQEGQIDVLVNNAGTVGSYAGVAEIEPELWHSIVAVNQTGVFNGMHTVIPSMLARQAGAVINVSSIWGIVGAAGVSAYQASKGAVRTMSKNAAMTYAQQGVRVNSLHPGIVRTPLIAAQDEEVTAAVVEATPMGRMADPDELAAGALFLASDESSFMTGAELVIDGGYTAQ